jgi:putative oxidoreductase
MARSKNIALWILQAVLAVSFLGAGGSKLAGVAAMVQLFDTIGIGQWFRYVTGALEVGSAVLLLIPGMAAVASAVLTCVMVGAIITHLAILHTSPLSPVVLLVLALIVLWGRWDQIAARFGLAQPGHA